MNLRKRFGFNLATFRKAKKISQSNLAKLSGVSKAHIGYIENSRFSASLDVIESLSLALEIDPCLLMGRPSIKFSGTKIKTLNLLPIFLEEKQAAYCFYTKEGMEFHPLAKGNFRNALTMMALLQANNFTGKELVEQSKKLHLPFDN